MSEAAPIGHNRGPVTAPSAEDALADLQARFPEVDIELGQMEKDLAGYPKKLTLKDADVAQALQDLLSKGKKLKSNLAGYKKEEKKPWDGIVKVVQNFFATREEKLATMMADAGAVHEDYLQQKRDEAQRAAEAEAEAQRQAAEAARREREEADRRAAEAEERRLAAEKEEREARERAAAEEARAKAAREEAERLEAEERRLAAERKERERAEKETNADNLKKIRGHMKEADKLNASIIDAGEEPSDAEVQQLDALIKPGGIVSLLSSPVANSTLLDDVQRTEIEDVRTRITDLRKAVGERLDAKERRKREKARKEEEEREKAEAEKRRIAREADEERARVAREAREKAEREADEARAGAKDAQAEAREARGEQRAAFSDKKAAGKDAAKAGQVADRAENRADRIDRKLDNSTDADLSRTRGELGSVGSLRRSWKHHIVDEAALRAVCGPLGPHFTTDALENALFHVMRAHQAAFTGERVEGETIGVPGAMFAYETDAQIR